MDSSQPGRGRPNTGGNIYWKVLLLLHDDHAGLKPVRHFANFMIFFFQLFDDVRKHLVFYYLRDIMYPFHFYHKMTFIAFVKHFDLFDVLFCVFASLISVQLKKKKKKIIYRLGIKPVTQTHSQAY